MTISNIDFGRPGVYVSEAPLPRDTGALGGTTARSVLVGVLTQGPDTPTLVSSWNEFTSIFGSWGTSEAHNAAVDAAYAFFSNGPQSGASLVVLRLVGENAATATVDVPGISGGTSFSATAVSPGTWGNNVTVRVSPVAYLPDGFDPANYSADFLAEVAELADQFNLVIEHTVGGTVVRQERYRNLSMNSDARMYAPAVVNSSSYLVRIDAVDAGTVPAASDPYELAGGTDGADPVVDFSPLDSIRSPLTIYLAAAHSVASGQVAATAYATARSDSFVILDTPESLNTADISTLVDEMATPISPHCAFYYPWVSIVDPQRSGGNIRKNIAPGGVVLGTYARSDAQFGPWRTPAGTSLPLTTVVAPVRNLTDGELDTLNTGVPPINAIRPIPGSGVCIMGARTADQSNADRYVAIRRSLSFIVANLKNISEYALFQPNGQELWEDLTAKIEDWLGRYYQQGALRGSREPEAFYVKINASNNTPASIAAGEVHVEVGVAVEFPAEFVVIRLTQNQGSISV